MKKIEDITWAWRPIGDYGKMTKPDFFCQNFFECQNFSKDDQPDDCPKQCDSCINEIIDHHSKKIDLTKK